ncbi:hypothetical protein AB4114_22215 [Paenibacillus sp. 2RAB27]|uniref:hypothetical protein n=1 Tax=Paenibacillus sp. 2RAB27 TaxID=3232991 RepID=UPI003F9545BC
MGIESYIRSEIYRVQEELAKYSDDGVPEKLLRRLNLLVEISSFIHGLDWLTPTYLRQRYATLINGMELGDVARLHGVSVDSLASSVSLLEHRLQLLLGGVVGFLMSGEIERAGDEFELRTGRGSHPIFPSFVHSMIRPVEHRGVDVESCELEIELLSSLVLSQVEVRILSLDRQKLEHLLYIVNNDIQYRTIHSLLMRCLEGGIEPAETTALIAYYNDSLRPTFGSKFD